MEVISEGMASQHMSTDGRIPVDGNTKRRLWGGHRNLVASWTMVWKIELLTSILQSSLNPHLWYGLILGKSPLDFAFAHMICFGQWHVVESDNVSVPRPLKRSCVFLLTGEHRKELFIVRRNCSDQPSSLRRVGDKWNSCPSQLIELFRHCSLKQSWGVD